MGMTIIKNYEMPHNCYDCDLHNYHECDLTNESIEEDYCWNGDSREKHCPLREVEAIPKADYENRLKADLKAILVELQLEIEEKEQYYQDKFLESKNAVHDAAMGGRMFGCGECKEIIQQKIKGLRGEEHE